MKRRTFLKVLGAGAGLAVLATAAGFATAFIAKFSIEHQLHVMGWPEARVEYLELTSTGLIIDHIALDPDDFSGIDTIEASINPLDLLLHGEIDRVKIKDINLSGEFDEAGQLKIAGWDATIPDMAGGGGGGISSLLLQGVTLDVETPEGSLRFEGKASLSQSDKTEGQKDIQFSLWGQQKQLSFSANGSGQIAKDGRWQLTAACAEGRVDMADVKVNRATGQLEVHGAPGQPTDVLGKMVVGFITYGDASFQNVNMLLDTRQSDIFTFETSPTGVPDVTLFGKISGDTPRLVSFHGKGDKLSHVTDLFGAQVKEKAPSLVNVNAAWSAMVSLPFEDVLAPTKKISWTASLATSGHSLSVSGDAVTDGAQMQVKFPQEFSVKAEPLNTFFPFLSSSGFHFAGGDIGVSGDVALSLVEGADAPLSHLTLKPLGLEGTWQGVPFRDLLGGVTLEKLDPLVFAGAQTQTFILGGQGEDVGSGQISFSSSPEGAVNVTQVHFDVAGGTIDLSPFSWSSAQKKAATVVMLKNFDLQKLVQLGGAQGFSASGTLGGDVPIEISDKGVVFKNGVLRAQTAGGHFSYTPTDYPASLRGDDARMNTLREALKDFQYTLLSLTLDGPLTGNMAASLKASGRNPVFERPLELNINLSGDVGKAMQTVLGLQPLPQ